VVFLQVRHTHTHAERALAHTPGQTIKMLFHPIQASNTLPLFPACAQYSYSFVCTCGLCDICVDHRKKRSLTDKFKSNCANIKLRPDMFQQYLVDVRQQYPVIAMSTVCLLASSCMYMLASDRASANAAESSV
jgi:hypothetical protein